LTSVRIRAPLRHWPADGKLDISIVCPSDRVPKRAEPDVLLARPGPGSPTRPRLLGARPGRRSDGGRPVNRRLTPSPAVQTASSRVWTLACAVATKLSERLRWPCSRAGWVWRGRPCPASLEREYAGSVQLAAAGAPRLSREAQDRSPESDRLGLGSSSGADPVQFWRSPSVSSACIEPRSA